MPSEWAKKTARETWGIFGGTSSKEPLIMAIAAELDAARIEGLEEATKIAASAFNTTGNGHENTCCCVRCLTAALVESDIRARIEEIKR